MKVATIIRIARNYGLHRFGRCVVCGRRTLFLVGNEPDTSQMRESLLCVFCRSSSRKRHVALALLRYLGLPERSLLEARPHLIRWQLYSASANDALYNAIGKGNPNFVASEYFPDVPAGEEKNGVLCQNLEALTFADHSFDVVITEDVLEHVQDWEQAVREIARVLKPAGAHIFTVPLWLDRPTVERVRIRDGHIEYLLPPEYHGDPIRGKILAYRNFGIDVLEKLRQLGFETQLQLSTYRDILRFGIADSIVLVSRKRQR